MNKILKIITVTAGLLILQACAEGGGGSSDEGGFSPTSPDTEFQLSSGDFTEGEQSSKTYSGFDSDGYQLTMATSSKVLAKTTFMGKSAIPIFSRAEITDISTGAVFTGSGTDYWSSSVVERHYLGSRENTTTVSAQTTALPKTAFIGDFGDIGSYTDSAGSVKDMWWRLDDAGNGYASFITSTSTTNQSGAIEITTKTQSIIDASGNTISIKIIFFYLDSGLTITFNSN